MSHKEFGRKRLLNERTEIIVSLKPVGVISRLIKNPEEI